MPEEKEVHLKFTVVKLLNYGALAAIAVGLLYGILAAVGAPEYTSGTYAFAEFLKGLFLAILGGGMLAGLAEIVSRKQQ